MEWILTNRENCVSLLNFSSGLYPFFYSSRKWPSGSVFNMNKYFASGNKQDTYNITLYLIINSVPRRKIYSISQWRYRDPWRIWPAGPIGHINEIPHFSYSTGYTTVSLKSFIKVHSVIHSRESGTQKGSIPWAILDQKRVIMKIISLNFFFTLLFNLVSLYVYS